jgi:hypothetical protein
MLFMDSEQPQVSTSTQYIPSAPAKNKVLVFEGKRKASMLLALEMCSTTELMLY